MTIASATVRNDYTGDGSTDTFPFTFKAVAASDLRVILTDTDGAEAVQTITTHYTLTGVGATAGGNVVFVTPPTDQYLVSIISNMPRTQTTDLANESGFFQERIEAALDRAVRIAQQAHGVATRGVVTPEHEPAGIQLPSKQDRANTTLGFDANGDLYLYPTP